jgi:hypothetical protein
MKDELLIAINHLCTYTEYKILFAAAYHNEAIPTFAEIQRLTGITKSCNYFKSRKQLVNLGYLTINDTGMYINEEKIINDYRRKIEC